MNRLTRHLLITLAVVLTTTGAALAAPGALDHTFGDNGRRLFDFTPDPIGADQSGIAAVLPDGRFLALGMDSSNVTGHKARITRHLADGSLDASFATAGKVEFQLE